MAERKKYARHEAKAQRKRQNRRVDYLFRMLEKQNPDGIKFDYRKKLNRINGKEVRLIGWGD